MRGAATASRRRNSFVETVIADAAVIPRALFQSRAGWPFNRLEFVAEIFRGDQPLVLVVLRIAGDHVAKLGGLLLASALEMRTPNKSSPSIYGRRFACLRRYCLNSLIGYPLQNPGRSVHFMQVKIAFRRRTLTGRTPGRISGFSLRFSHRFRPAVWCR